MIRRAMAAVVVGMVMASLAPAQAPRFEWRKGQVLIYRVDETSVGTEEVGGTKVEARTRHAVLKRWDVLDVDAAGVATLQQSNVAFVYELTMPGGEVRRYDSAHPDKSNPELAKQLGDLVGKPLVVLRVDAQGKVVEVKEAKYTGATLASYETKPPFVVVLPSEALKPGLAWTRDYQFTVPPPNGVNDKYPAMQRYTCKSVADNLVTVTLATEVKDPPKALADRIPLIQDQPEGEIVYDVKAGRLHSAKLRIDKELTGHRGEGSRYHFQSVHTEQYVGDR